MLVRPSPQLRNAELSDVRRLVEIEKQCFTTDQISNRSFRSLIKRQTARVIVAELEGIITGYALLLFRRGTAMARLYSLAVAPECAGSGTGALLLAEAERRTFNQGRMSLRLEVHEGNDRAIALYRKSGYRPIGQYLDYYEDHATALRFEKTLRGDVPTETTIPYYEQTTDFTCGPSCLMMAFARFDPGYSFNPVKEIKLWREATTVYMMAGTGGCDPYGLAVSACEGGLEAELYVSQPGTLFADSVRSDEKRKIMELAQQDFRERAEDLGIVVHEHAFSMGEITNELSQGNVAIVLVSGYHMFGKKVPHWVLAHGYDGDHILIHDPWVEEEVEETHADAANLPVPCEQFDRMSKFGKNNLRSAVIIRQKRKSL